MAIKKSTTTASFPFFLLLLLLISTILHGVLLKTAYGIEDSVRQHHHHQQQQQRNPGSLGSETKLRAQDYSREVDIGEPQGWRAKRNRRLMIGSTAPTCTYNECRGCRFKCRAEQIPVDANDPINSAYHYRCVCHR